GKNEVGASTYKLGLGSFDFTPNPKEAYTVRFTTESKEAQIADPFAKLGGIRPAGVALHVPKAVGSEGDPIRVVLHQAGPARQLVVLAHCRGQVVDQRTIVASAGATEVTLQ